MLKEKPPLKSPYIVRCLSLRMFANAKCGSFMSETWRGPQLRNIGRRYQEDRQKMIRVSDHFSHRKRSRSKVKTQERKPEEQASPGSDPEEEGATARPEVTN